jgi:hypothetical protein
MFRSLEVRWFYAGAVPEPVRQWFGSGQRQPYREPLRVDRYLRLGRGDALGIKLRQGRLEIKQRLGADEILRFSAQARGRVAHWRKWSFALDTREGELAGSSAPESAWVAVEKARELRRYCFVPGGQIVAIPAGQFPARGCTAELSSLTVEGQAWWTVCLEAYGGESHLQEALMLTAGRVLGRSLPAFTFDADDSFGYPRWLGSLAAGRASARPE